MKPQFALDLTHTGIRLVHVAGGARTELGSVDLDDPDFDFRIHDLYERARRHAKGPVRTILLIPASEVLYTRVPANGPDREARDDTVRRALDGMTPYSVDQLVYDWRAQNDEALVAAVARETLEEAEGFAVRYGFNPVQFSTTPRDGAFRGTPNFGRTKLAEARASGAPWPDPPAPPAMTMADLDAVEEPAAPVDATGPVAPAPAPAKAPAAEDAAPAIAPAQVPEPEPTPEPARAETGPCDATAAVADTGPAPADVTHAAPEKESDAPVAAPTPADRFSSRAGKRKAGKTPAPEKAAPPDQPDDAQSVATAAADTSDDPSGTARPAKAAGGTFRSRADRAAEPVRRPGRMSLSVPDRPAGGVGTDAAPAAKTADAAPAFRHEPVAARTAGAAAPSEPAMTAVAPDAGFTSGRAGPDKSVAETGAVSFAHRGLADRHPASQPDGDAAPAPAGIPSPAAENRLSRIMARISSVPDGGQPLSERGARHGRAEPKVTDAAAPDTPTPADAPAAAPAAPTPATDPAAASPKPPKPPRGDMRAVARSATAGLQRHAPKVPTARALAEARQARARAMQEADNMTVFGARGRARAERSIMPLLLMVAVALFLAVAVWASYLLLGRSSATLGDATSTAALLSPTVEVLPVPEAPATGTATGTATVTATGTAPTPLDDSAPILGAPIETLGLADDGAGDTLAVPSEIEASSAEGAPAGPEVALLDETIGAVELPPGLSAPERPQSDIGLLAQPGAEAAAPALGRGAEGPLDVATPGQADAPAPDTVPATPVTAQPLPTPASRPDAVARYASIGIWLIPPEAPALPPGGRIDDLRLASLDPRVATGLASALPAAPAAADRAPPDPLAPPTPAGTGTGGLTGDGVRVTEGPPPLLPPARPRFTLVSATGVRINPGDLPALRPLPRPAPPGAQDETSLDGPPANLTTDVALGANDRAAALGDRVENAIAEATADAAGAGSADDAAARPLTRPSSVATDATPVVQPPVRPAARPAAGTTDLARTEPADADASAFVVTASYSPPPRPADFARQIEATFGSGPVAAAHEVAPPTQPTTASVARLATNRNALAMGRVSLIGVFGPVGDLKALVRLPGGDFVRVGVGDAIDGGRVASIGDDGLRYVKSGRSILLEMPRA